MKLLTDKVRFKMSALTFLMDFDFSIIFNCIVIISNIYVQHKQAHHINVILDMFAFDRFHCDNSFWMVCSIGIRVNGKIAFIFRHTAARENSDWCELKNGGCLHMHVQPAVYRSNFRLSTKCGLFHDFFIYNFFFRISSVLCVFFIISHRASEIIYSTCVPSCRVLYSLPNQRS